MRRLPTILLSFMFMAFTAWPAAAQDATPSTQGALWTPRDTLNALLASPFPADLLPAGTPPPTVSQWTDAADSDLEGTVGAVQMTLSENGVGGIYFLVYPTNDAALSSYGTSASAVAQSQGTPVPLTEVPASFFLDYGDYAVCVTLVQNVVIIGGAETPADGSSIADLACAYATAGQTHLNTIFAEQPKVTPLASQPMTGLDLLNQLIDTPFPSTDLPGYVSDPIVREWPADDTDLAGAVGGATLNVAGDDTTGMSWIVYADEATAQSNYSGFATALGTPVADAATPAALTQVADGYALCLGIQGQVIVIGAYTVDEGGTNETAQERACELMAVGQQRVRDLTTSLEATPIASMAERVMMAFQNLDFSTTGLPAQFTDPVTTITTDVDDAFGVVAQISVNVNGSDTTGISYLVYPSLQHASQWMDANAISIGQANGPIGGEDGNTWESYIVTNSAAVTCIAQADNVIVIGIADFQTENPPAAACSLTLAGLAQLQSILH